MKVTFDSGILFTTGNANLSAAAKSALSKFANNVLNQNRDMDVSIYGYTDNQGWKNSTAAQSQQKEPEPVTRTCTECIQLLIKLRCFLPTRLKACKVWVKSDPRCQQRYSRRS